MEKGGSLVTTSAFDDGGLSGGNMERPGAQQLLQGYPERPTTASVVYKVDLPDPLAGYFAKILGKMEVF